MPVPLIMTRIGYIAIAFRPGLDTALAACGTPISSHLAMQAKLRNERNAKEAATQDASNAWREASHDWLGFQLGF